jgi:hypothetical protein
MGTAIVIIDTANITKHQFRIRATALISQLCSSERSTPKMNLGRLNDGLCTMLPSQVGKCAWATNVHITAWTPIDESCLEEEGAAPSRFKVATEETRFSISNYADSLKRLIEIT